MSTHPHQITDPLVAKTFVLGGDAVFTIVSVATEVRFTFKVSTEEGKGVYFVALLSGPDNQSDYRYMGIIPKDDPLTFRITAKSKIGPEAPSAKAFTWLWRQLGMGRLPASVEFWHEGRCGRCGLPLTDPQSIAVGLGPICRGKV